MIISSHVNHTDNRNMLQVQKKANIPLFAMFETINSFHCIYEPVYHVQAYLLKVNGECSTLQRAGLTNGPAAVDRVLYLNRIFNIFSLCTFHKRNKF